MNRYSLHTLIQADKRPLSLDYTYGEEGGPFDGLAAEEIDQLDCVGWVNLFHQIPQEQMEVMVCLFLGLKPLEIVKVLDYRNIARYYNVNNKLRKSYKLKKALFVD
jgi:hypothetical protein